MQFSKNRFNFTAKSVAQFNYAKFVNRDRATIEDVHGIIMVLGLHCENWSNKNNHTVKSTIKTTPHRSNNSIMIYKKHKKLKRKYMFVDNQWFRVEIFKMCCDNLKTVYKIDFRLCVVISYFFIKSCKKPFYTIHLRGDLSGQGDFYNGEFFLI